MASNSSIEWCDTTWNPLAGCTWASEGCDRCYAAIMARRLDFMAQADIAAGRDPGRKRKYIGITNKNKAGRIMFNGKVNLDRAALSEPFYWSKPRKVFVNSMSDLFHKDVPDDFIWDVWRVMCRTPQHFYQVLTKRPERMAEWTQQYGAFSDNVIAMTSVENQEQADIRIPHLLKVKARLRGLSCEPLLGAVDLTHLLVATPCWRCGNLDGEAGRCYCGVYIEPEIHWVIVGGESGHGARPMHPDWARSLRDQAQAAGVAYFFKQHGEYIHETQVWRNPMTCNGVINAEAHNSLMTGKQELADRGWQHKPDLSISYRVGKHVAGRMLDGIEYSEFPR